MGPRTRDEPQKPYSERRERGDPEEKGRQNILRRRRGKKATTFNTKRGSLIKVIELVLEDWQNHKRTHVAQGRSKPGKKRRILSAAREPTEGGAGIK